MNRLGLTLMELIVALTITGFALTVGYAGVSSIVDSRVRLDSAMARVAEDHGIRSSLASWIEGARAVTEEDGRRADPRGSDQDAGPGQPTQSAFDGPQFRGLDGVYRQFDDDELWFLTTATTPLGRGEFIVRLFIDREDTTPMQGLVASIAEWRGTKSAQVTVDPAVSGLDIRYHTKIFGRNQLLPSWVSSTVLPAAVEVHLTATPGDTLQALLSLPLIVTLRGGA